MTEGIIMKEIRILVRCTAEENHGKILRFRPTESLVLIEAIAALLRGDSPCYVYPPGPGSPIGRCAICQAPLEAEIKQIDDGKGPSTFKEDLRKSLEENNAESGKQAN